LLRLGYGAAYSAGRTDAFAALNTIPEGDDTGDLSDDEDTGNYSDNPTYEPDEDDTEDEQDDWSDETDDAAQTAAVDEQADQMEDSLLAFGALLIGGYASMAQLDAWLGTYASTLNPLYEDGFQDGVQNGAEIEQATWVSETDGAVCEDCKNLNGMTWVGDEIDGAMPHPGDSEFGGRTECGPNCFVEGTLVEGRFVSGMRSWYVGELIELRTMRGHRLTVTPNHPIATPSGFVSAHSLVEGNYVLSQLVVIDPSKSLDVENGPAAIEQVLEALKDGPSAWSGEWEPRSVDLHGDAVGVKGNVYVVGSDRKLLRGGNATSLDGLRKFSLISSDMSGRTTLSERPSSIAESFSGDGTTSGDLPSRSEQVASGLVTRGPSSEHSSTAVAYSDAVTSEDGGDGRAWNLVGLSEYLPRDTRLVEATDDVGGQIVGRSVSVPPVVVHSVGRAAEIDTRLSEPAGYSIDADTEFVRDMASRFPTLVSEDQVIEVIRRDGFEGHVYDLGAEGGWLSAGGIIAGNCRCSIDYTIIPLDQATYSWGGFDDNVEEFSTADLLKVWAILKYSPDQARDERGEWTVGGGERVVLDFPEDRVMTDWLTSYEKIAIEVSLHIPVSKSPLKYDALMLEHRAALERELAALPKGRTWVLPHN
jgi:hypothetical protein